MPAGKIYRAKRSGKKMMKRSTKMSIARSVSMSGLPFPPQKYQKFVYWDQYVLAQGSGVPVLQQMRLNSLYDPDLTGVGHQPYYYDQITQVYGKYKVYAVDIQYWYTNNGNGRFTLRPSVSAGTAATLTGFQLEAERPYSVCRAYSVNGPPTTGKIRVLNRKILGVSKDQYNDDDKYSALINANPEVQTYLNIMSLTTADNSIGDITLKLTYYAKMYERTPVTSS